MIPSAASSGQIPMVVADGTSEVLSYLGSHDLPLGKNNIETPVLEYRTSGVFY